MGSRRDAWVTVRLTSHDGRERERLARERVGGFGREKESQREREKTHRERKDNSARAQPCRSERTPPRSLDATRTVSALRQLYKSTPRSASRECPRDESDGERERETKSGVRTSPVHHTCKCTHPSRAVVARALHCARRRAQCRRERYD